jgi:hypothetical protein
MVDGARQAAVTGRHDAGQGIPILGGGLEWPIGPRWAARGEKHGGPHEEKKKEGAGWATRPTALGRFWAPRKK